MEFLESQLHMEKFKNISLITGYNYDWNLIIPRYNLGFVFFWDTLYINWTLSFYQVALKQNFYLHIFIYHSVEKKIKPQGHLCQRFDIVFSSKAYGFMQMNVLGDQISLSRN